MTTIAEPMLIDRVAWLRLLHDIDTVICDADGKWWLAGSIFIEHIHHLGVLWLGNRAIDGAVDLLNELRTMVCVVVLEIALNVAYILGKTDIHFDE
jgi:uncharacterized protein with ACT and thioredoxin-like domain